jgi:hypothetical protein
MAGAVAWAAVGDSDTLSGYVVLELWPIRFGLVFRGGPLELEQMVSADPPLAVHCLYGGRHRQHRGRGYRQVCRLGGLLGAAPARLAPVHRSVLVRAAVCHQVAQRATYRLNGRPAARRKAVSPAHEWQGGRDEGSRVRAFNARRAAEAEAATPAV